MTVIEDATEPLVGPADREPAPARPAPRRLGGLAAWVRGLFALYIVVSILYIANVLVMALTSVPDALWSIFLTAYSVNAYLGPAQTVVFLLCVAVFAPWTYRAMKNLHLRGADVSMRPGWAVGWYFVPLANLLMPREGMVQIWAGSADPEAPYTGASNALVNWWWATWLITTIGARLTDRLIDNLETGAIDVEQVGWGVLASLYYAGAAFQVVGIACTGLLGIIVRRVSEMQDRPLAEDGAKRG